jgi:hypothetical protein
MTPEYRLAQIIETIRALQFGKPVTKGGVTLLLEPWPDLYWEAMDREGMGWINLLQAAAARIERVLDD